MESGGDVEIKKKIYFISDIHLKFIKDDAEKVKREKLLGFLKRIQIDADHLYILGDLFDFWYEWRHVVPAYWFDLFYQFKTLIRNGIKISFITGNHDFHTGAYLRDEIGFDCFDEHTTLELDTVNGKKRFFLAHGDGYAKKDRGYRVLKKVIRNRLSIFLFKTFIHPDFGMWIARKTSAASGKHRNDGPDWRMEYFEFAKRKFDESYDYVVLGHLHKAERIADGERVYVNCGNWIRSFSYGVFDGQDLLLEYY